MEQIKVERRQLEKTLEGLSEKDMLTPGVIGKMF
jgi:hypothetical protein